MTQSPSKRLLTEANGGTGATIVVAASDSVAKRGVQFRCTGTNDQATINAALAALPTNGGRVLLLAGTYSLSGSIVINRKQVVLTGEGMGFWAEYVGGIPTASAAEGLGMTKLKATAGTFPLIKVDNTTQSGLGATARLNGIEISSMYIYGASKSNTASVGISCFDSGRPTDMFRAHNLMIHNVYDGIVLLADSPDISRCSIQDCGNRGIYMPNNDGVTNTGSTFTSVYPNIHHNVIADIGGHCIQLDYQVINAIIANNVLARGNAGVFTTALGGLIQGNQFIGQLGADACHSYGGWTQIMGNQFDGCAGIAVHLDGNLGGAVIDNVFNVQHQAITVFNAQMVAIRGNQIRTTLTNDHEINLYNSTGLIVSGNQMWLTAGTKAGGSYAIQTGGGCTGIFTNNVAKKYPSLAAAYGLPTNDGTTVVNSGNLSFAA